ncbi:MAG: DUF2059 domain-containing protein [Kiritimatiellae bacterium]|jgi:hypothetical protein|nr:DUF2059 domain-containing protein [Kiritimatiellia bacterium]MDY0150207.1 DUF2059 domain-containing protein [Kiritimatiellia bacterium]
MQLIKHSTLALILLSLLAGPLLSVSAAKSAEPPAQDLGKINELLIITRVEETMTAAMVSILADLIATTPEWRVHDDILLDYTEEQVGWEALHPRIVALYAQLFTDADIQALIDFYTSPAGQKLLEATPDLSERTRQLVTERFEAKLHILEMRMKHRELEQIEHEMSFIPAEETP